MCAGYASSPHHEHDAKVVELVAKFMHAGAVIREGMENRREYKAYDNTNIVESHSYGVLPLDPMG